MMISICVADVLLQMQSSAGEELDGMNMESVQELSSGETGGFRVILGFTFSDSKTKLVTYDAHFCSGQHSVTCCVT